MNDDETTPDHAETPSALRPDAVSDASAGDAGDPLAGLLGGLDMGSLLSMAGEMQQQMQQAQQTAAATEVTGSAGGGAVKITLTGAMECTEVSIAPEAFDDREMLEDLVQSALRDALSRANAVRGEDPFGDLGGLSDQLGGLFGG